MSALGRIRPFPPVPAAPTSAIRQASGPGRTGVGPACETVTPMTRDTPTQKADRVLGRLVLRAWAIVAFVGAAASTAFGAAALGDGQLPGLLLLALGAFLFWIGLRAWRDRAGLGELLNRDFGRTPATGKENDARGDGS